MSVRNDILDNLIVAMKDMRSGDLYSATLKSDPVLYNRALLDRAKDETPCLMVVDDGTERVAVRTETETMYVADISVWGFVSGFDWGETQEQINELIADVKVFVNTEPDLGAAVLQLRFVGVEGSQYDEQNKRAATRMALTIRYKVSNGTY